MIELQYPERVASSIITRLNELIQSGYLLHDYTSDDDGYISHNYYTDSDELQYELRIDGEHFETLSIAEFIEPGFESTHVTVLGSPSNRVGVQVTENSPIELVEFEIATIELEAPSFEDATRFAFELDVHGKTGWRLPTWEECASHSRYNNLSGFDDTEHFWTMHGAIWSSDSCHNTTSDIPKLATAVRCIKVG